MPKATTMALCAAKPATIHAVSQSPYAAMAPLNVFRFCDIASFVASALRNERAGK
jgi:hypothetical protein